MKICHWSYSGSVYYYEFLKDQIKSTWLEIILKSLPSLTQMIGAFYCWTNIYNLRHIKLILFKQSARLFTIYVKENFVYFHIYI